MNKKVRCIDDCSLSYINSGEIYKVEREDGFVYKLFGLESWYSKERFEDVIEPKFKVGDKVIFARKDDGEYKCWNNDFAVGKEYEIREVLGDYPRVIADKGGDIYMPPECFDLVTEPKQEVKPEPKYPIIERFGIYKVVFNPPYTIVEAYIFGEPYFKGKAKCNPKDTFDKWEGFKIAMSRLEQI